MKRASDFTREFATGMADLETRRSRPGEIAGNCIGFVLLVALLSFMAYGLLLDCGGATC